MKLKSLFIAADGHKRSSFILTIVAVLGFLLDLLKALPVELHTEWVSLAIAVIGVLLMTLNRPKEATKKKE